jgi:ParB family chromosome partitioning protein
VAYNRAAAHGGDGLSAVLRGAAVQVHYQGVAVPHLAAGNDVAGLLAVARNRGFPEEARLGAVEGLAAAVSEEAEAELVRLGETEGEPEELRKAAWRGLRRSKRARLAAARRAARTEVDK